MDEQRPLFPIATTSTSSSTSQLFPVACETGFQVSGIQERPVWLSNQSFSESLLPAPTPVPDWYAEEQLEFQKQEEDYDSGQNVEILPVSSHEEDNKDDSEQDRQRKESSGENRKGRHERSHRHEKKKGKRRKTSEGTDVDHTRRLLGSSDGRKRLVEIEIKEYQVDAKGDRDNLVYESLYRKHVPLFYRHKIRICSSKQRKPAHSFFGSIKLEDDNAVMDEKLKENRYWSGKFASLERRKDFRRLKISINASNSRGSKVFSDPHNDFISVEDSNIQEEELDATFTVREESWDGYINRKTKEFNQLTRERPQDESLWIAFAKFQDELIQAASKKAVMQQAVEKKIAVLEKALEMHPFSEDLWLLLLDTCQKKDLAQALLTKWENAIRRNPKSYKLWKGYLHFRRGEFSLFKVSSVRKAYFEAIQTFWAAHNLKDAERIEEDNKSETEKSLVSLFMDLCRFEWQTGHHELAIGLLQAQVEYSIFAPLLAVSERSKKRLFQEFWDSGAPRVGEDGAVGWASWLQKEEEWIKKAFAKDQADDAKENEEEKGGWTGWYDPAVDKGNLEDGDQVHQSDGEVEVKDVEDETMDAKDDEEEEHNEAMLLERLGLSFGTGDDMEVKSPETWRRWSEKEHSRDLDQWLPLRSSVKVTDDEGLPEADEEDEQLERVVLFEDIQDCLFSLETPDAQFELICQFMDFCSGPYPLWCCSNSLKWTERMEALDHLFGPLLKELESAHMFVEGASNRDSVIRRLVGGVEWMHEGDGRCDFLANSLLLLRPFCSHSFWFQEKLMSIEGHRAAHGRSGSFGPRVLAKKLLRNDRQALLLSGAYACSEALAGSFEVACKVFDTTLASLSSLPADLQIYGPIIYQAYAEMELSRTSDASKEELTHQKVLHILSCLGSGVPYTPFRANNPVTGTQLLKAKRGFKEQLQNARKKRDQADLSSLFKSFIVCATIFELLADGLAAATTVFEESFALSLPGKRQQNLQFELLHFTYVNMLEEHKQASKPTALRHTILRGLTQYPTNPQLLGAYIRCSSRSACTNDLRRFFDDVLRRNPSTVLWLFAISIELGRPGSGPRIHSLFEKAVETVSTQQSVVLWRCYIAYELQVKGDMDAARRVYFRAIHACPWSKLLWLDGFRRMGTILSAKELSDFQDIMREKELRLRTDVYEILLEDEAAED